MKLLLTTFICLVWFVNGFVCKVMNLVPRHQQIVSGILGEEFAEIFTKAIGVSEVLMVVWIISGIKRRFCAIFQMSIVGAMNIIEFFTVPELLLLGRLNIVWAAIFILAIYVNEFGLKRQNRNTVTQ